jgi:DNA polymerase zeta
VCDALTRVDQPLCEKCLGEPQMAVGVLGCRAARLERQYQQLVRLCLHCGGGGGGEGLSGGVVCESLDCGVYYERKKAWRELGAMSALAAAAGRALGERGEQRGVVVREGGGGSTTRQGYVPALALN